MLLQMKTPVIYMFIGTAMMALAACERVPSSPSTNFPSADTASNASHFEALMAEEEFSVGDKTPHCIALLGKIKVNRLAFTQNTDWNKVLQTEEWARFHGLYTGYRSGGCPSLTSKHATITQPCLEGRDALLNAWNDVENTASWKLARQDTRLQCLVASWDDAKTTGCLLAGEKT